MKRLAIAVIVLAVCRCASRPAAPAASRSRAAQAAIEELAKTTAAPESEITIVLEEERTWPDSCLGCPDPSEMCAQVLTPGSRIVLLARGVTYEYHTSRSGRVRPCK
jgi:hypothetical protein